MNHSTSTDVVVITGMSGSGKSVALAALEDSGYYCVDNLPPELLLRLLELPSSRALPKIGIAIDARSPGSLPKVPQLLDGIHQQGMSVRVVFLDASTDALIRRFSETRRRHPLSSAHLSDQHQALIQAIATERELLADLRERALIIDTSLMRSAQLQTELKFRLDTAHAPLTLLFQSFAFKKGVPRDADYVFDVRILPNPHYEPQLRPLNGKDEPVASFLARQPEVARMIDSIDVFLRQWLPAMQADHRTYVTVAIGCTGGQHRSVYICEKLALRFATGHNTMSRHRELGEY